MDVQGYWIPILFTSPFLRQYHFNIYLSFARFQTKFLKFSRNDGPGLPGIVPAFSGRCFATPAIEHPTTNSWIHSSTIRILRILGILTNLTTANEFCFLF